MQANSSLRISLDVLRRHSTVHERVRFQRSIPTINNLGIEYYECIHECTQYGHKLFINMRLKTSNIGLCSEYCSRYIKFHLCIFHWSFQLIEIHLDGGDFPSLRNSRPYR